MGGAPPSCSPLRERASTMADARLYQQYSAPNKDDACTGRARDQKRIGRCARQRHPAAQRLRRGQLPRAGTRASARMRSPRAHQQQRRCAHRGDGTALLPPTCIWCGVPTPAWRLPSRPQCVSHAASSLPDPPQLPLTLLIDKSARDAKTQRARELHGGPRDEPAENY